LFSFENVAYISNIIGNGKYLYGIGFLKLSKV